MDTYRTFLYLHLVSLAIGLGAAAVLMVCLYQLKARADARRGGARASWQARPRRRSRVAVVGLFLTGAYMTHDVWSWDTGWIGSSLAGADPGRAAGTARGGRAASSSSGRCTRTGQGRLGEEARRMTRHPGLWVTEFANIGVILGIMWNMTQKPGTTEAILAIVIGYAVGLALALRATRTPARRAGRSPEPVG